jgi:general secretion pathway protein K
MTTNRKPRAQCGVALITALLIVALATTAAVAMTSRQFMDIRRSANVLEYDQAMLYVIGIEDWAGQMLRLDAEDNQVDSLDEAWATELPPIPVDGGQLAGRAEDMQGRFNLNALLAGDGSIDPIALERFRRLLLYLELDPELADRLADWVDADDETRMGGAEDVEYLGLEQPYRAGNRLFASPSELALLLGVTPEVMARLAPYVAALPREAALNVNTIAPDKPELVMALAADLARPEAEQLLAERGLEGFESVQEFLQQPALAGRAVSEQGLTVSSEYFMLTSHVQFGRSVFTNQSLVQRSSAGSRVLMRAQGTL